MLKNKNILLVSPEPWDHLFVSKHHYATHLAARGNQVFFLNPPTNRNACQETNYKNVFIVNYTGFIKGLRFFPAWIRKKLIRRKFDFLQKLCGVKFDIVWSFDNSVFFDFSALPTEVYCISHIVDLNQDFNTAIASSTANLCLGVIPEIVKRHHQYNSQAHLVTHAVQKLPDIYTPVQLPGNNVVKAMYAGNLAMPHMDWDLLLSIIKENTFVDFLFIGTGRPTIQIENQLKLYSNVYFIPPISSDQLIHYLHAADVLLLIYKPEYYRTYASPHKMMEYLGSEKMIIATWTEDYRDLAEAGLIKMSKNQDKYLDEFNEVIDQLAKWNSVEKISVRRAYAQANTYDKQIEKIETRLP